MVEYSTRFKRCAEAWFDEAEPVGPYDVVIRHRAPVRGTDRATSVFYTLRVDLTRSEDEIFKGFTRNTRAQIRKSVESDDFRFEFLHEPTLLQLQEFVEFYDQFADSKGLPRLFMPRMQAHMRSGLLSLTKVTASDRALAWHANVIRNAHVGIMFSASHHRSEDLPEARKMIGRANRRLHWEEMQHYRNRGLGIYDFGGWYEGSDDQEKLLINRFKEEFGGSKVLAFTVIEDRSLRAKFISAIKVLRGAFSERTLSWFIAVFFVSGAAVS